MKRPAIVRAERNQIIQRMYEEGASFKKIAEEVKCSVATVHKVVQALKKNSAGL